MENTIQKKPLKNISKVKKTSEETKKKLSESNKGNSNRCRSINQYSLDGKYINTFKSAKEAAFSVGSNHGSHISDCCSGRLKHFKGFRW